MSVLSNSKRDSLSSVNSFRSMESDDDSDIVCVDWTKISDDGEEGGHQCDTDGSPKMVEIDSPNIHSPQYVLVPDSVYILENLTLFHAMCCIEDLHFSSLEVSNQEKLMKSVKVESYRPGDYILREGEHSAVCDFFFVVSTAICHHDMAVVEVVKRDKVITRLFCGAVFGEKCFLTHNKAPRSASVRISADAAQQSPHSKSGGLIAIARVPADSQALWKILRNALIAKIIPYFGQLECKTRDEILGMTREEHFEAGESIVQQGSEGECFYLILDGCVKVVQSKQDENEEVESELANLRPGHGFGEMALLTRAPRVATAKAVSTTTCLSLSRQSFDMAVKKEGKVASFLYKLLEERQGVRERRNLRERSDSHSMSASDLTRVSCRPGTGKGSPIVKDALSYSAFWPGDDVIDDNNKENQSCGGGWSWNTSEIGKAPDSAPAQTPESPVSAGDNGCGKRSLASTPSKVMHSGTFLDMQCSTPSAFAQMNDARSAPVSLGGTPSSSFFRQLEVEPATLTKSLTCTKSTLGEKVLNGKYVIKGRLGRGSFGEVLEVRDQSNRAFAMKCLHRSQLKDNSSSKHAMEIKIMQRLRHPNIVAFYEVIDDPRCSTLFMIQEFMLRPLMPDKLINPPIEVPQCRKYFRDVLRGVAYLHACEIVHRDIKPQNILISNSGVAKIGDFGASAFTGGHECSTYLGTPAFTAPELSLPKDQWELCHSMMPAVDVFALGATLYTLVVGHPPWMGVNEIVLASKIKNLEPKLSRNVEPHLKHIILRMLDKDYATRITVKELEQHEWVTDEGAEPLYTRSERNFSPLALASNTTSAPDCVFKLGAGPPSPKNPMSSDMTKLVFARTEQSPAGSPEKVDNTPRDHLAPVPTSARIGIESCPMTGRGLEKERGNVAVATPSLYPIPEAILGRTGSGTSSFSLSSPTLSHKASTRVALAPGPLEHEHLVGTPMPEPSPPPGRTFALTDKRGVIFDQPSKYLHEYVEDGQNYRKNSLPSSGGSERAVPPEHSADEEKGTGKDNGEEDDNESFGGEAVYFDDDNALFDELDTMKKEWDEDKENWNVSLGTLPPGRRELLRNLKAECVGSCYGKVISRGISSSRCSNSTMGLKLGACVDQGCRLKQEDFIVTNLGGGDFSRDLLERPDRNKEAVHHLQFPDDTAIIAVFDGHGGPLVSRNLAKTLEKVYFTSLVGVCDERATHCGTHETPRESAGSLNLSRERDDIMCCALKQAIAQLEVQAALDVHSAVFNASHPLASVSRGLVGGSTATIITITKFTQCEIGGEKREVLQLVGAALGDSRAVLCRDGEAEPLMQDHRLKDNREEMDRVLKAGGEISNDRVWGDLQTTRSIGDLPYKKGSVKMVESLLARPSPERKRPLDPVKSLRMVQDNLWTDDQVITSCPDFFSLQIDLNDDRESVEFIILASDGLWDLVSSQEAVNFVRSDLLETQDLHMTAVGLVDLSLRRAMGAGDNISVVIVAFNQRSENE